MSLYTIYSPADNAVLRESSYMQQDATFIAFDSANAGARCNEASNAQDLNVAMTQEQADVFASMSHGTRKKVGDQVYCHQG